ncbi:hypothetical protein VHA_000156 [Grimontia hollisae CIP 101886]|uniref:Uncharacterized protein n=1 Tax=Grimontia hollisae CIP 101886 TaxID=675812 RepID=D0I325_GRIHO|nr:hypothetical protein VHA_000156 [Grimontia hollisae CIP 101886]
MIAMFLSLSICKVDMGSLSLKKDVPPKAPVLPKALTATD